MGKFDGILICSDWDGTLFCNNTVPSPTREAVEYFMSCGGHFAITSGRPPEYLRERSHLIKPNTYCICYGGSLVCHAVINTANMFDFYMDILLRRL